MPKITTALLGLGTVGEGVYQVIEKHQEKLKQLLGAEVEIAGILIRDPNKKRDVRDDVLITTDFDDILNISNLQLIFESIVGVEPAFTYLQKALNQGIHVITANKAMFARHGATLQKIAEEKGLYVGYEATVAAGVPLIRTIKDQLQINEINRIQAIVNGTSNFILTEMREKQLPFEEALKIAQDLGYAEADPTNDVEGFDAFYKLMILSQLAYGKQPDWDSVERVGIASLTEEDIRNAEGRYKHIAEIIKDGDNLKASVRPVLTGPDHPLYSVEGVDNAILLETSLAGTITIQGPGAGKNPTASAMVEDFVHIFQQVQRSTVLV